MRRTVIAQLIVFAAISVVVISFAVFQLLGVRIYNRPFPVTVHLNSAGGIFEDAEVAFRGVQVGRVDSMKLETGGVTLTLKIDHGTKIPDNSLAHVYHLSPVGEQYLDFEPPAHPSRTYLHSGSVVAANRTTVPLQTAAVLYDLQQLINSVNPNDVVTIGREGAQAFAGTGPDLRSLLIDVSRIVDELATTKDATLDLLRNAAVLLHGAETHAAQFSQFSTSLRQLTGTLAQSTPTVDKLLDQAEPTTRIVNELIRNNGNALTVLLANVATLSDIQVARVPALRALLVAVPEFGRLAPGLVKDGALQGYASIDFDQLLCRTGVPLTNPLSGKRSALDAVNCPGSLLARGAQNAPRPVASAKPSADGSTQVGSYDPLTGYVSTADGTMVRLGSTGGQADLLGNNSWQALLLAGTGG
jgi:phospholipid/cholesterol/gamma-HCH transport system substrate-binding protein